MKIKNDSIMISHIIKLSKAYAEEIKKNKELEIKLEKVKTEKQELHNQLVKKDLHIQAISKKIFHLITSIKGDFNNGSQ